MPLRHCAARVGLAGNLGIVRQAVSSGLALARTSLPDFAALDATTGRLEQYVRYARPFAAATADRTMNAHIVSIHTNGFPATATGVYVASLANQPKLRDGIMAGSSLLSCYCGGFGLCDRGLGGTLSIRVWV